MTETVGAPPPPPEGPPIVVDRRQTRGTDALIAGSSPDVNAIFQSLVDKFMAAGRIGGPIFAWWLSNIWVVAAIGVPAMLAAAPLVDKVYEGSAAERQFQLEMYKLQADIEIKKLDRTMLSDAAATTLKEISRKIDEQGQQIAKVVAAQGAQGAQIDKVVAAQDATARRLSGVAAKQGQLEKRFSQPAPAE